jgi:hypothetical protein
MNLSTQIMELSPRARKAYAVLQEGGRYVKRLEKNEWSGREQFQYRLLSPTGGVVKGYSFKVFWELEPFLRLADGGTSVSTYYKLPKI